MFVFVFLLGLIVGSFLSALTYRWPHDVSIAKGRSYCPKCKKQINWYSNIPLFSFLFQNGKCKNCGKKISIRYPLIEFFTALVFSLNYLLLNKLILNLEIFSRLNIELVLIFSFIFIAIFIAIFVIDLEHQYIPDTFTFVGLALVLILLIFSADKIIFISIAAGLGLSLFLLLINLLTFGKGMGLGDVKLAIFIGTLLGFPLGVVWMFLSFVIGSVIGLIFIATGKTKFGKQIPFGPFLITAAIFTMWLGDKLLLFAFPYLL